MTLARIRTGDTVVVISGKDKKKTGKVLRVLADQDKVVVEKINMVKRHVRPSQTNREGGIFDREAPIHVSKVMLIDPESGKPTRIRTKVQEDGSKLRVAVKSGKTIENPPLPERKEKTAEPAAEG